MSIALPFWIEDRLSDDLEGAIDLVDLAYPEIGKGFHLVIGTIRKDLRLMCRDLPALTNGKPAYRAICTDRLQGCSTRLNALAETITLSPHATELRSLANDFERTAIKLSAQEEVIL